METNIMSILKTKAPNIDFILSKCWIVGSIIKSKTSKRKEMVKNTC